MHRLQLQKILILLAIGTSIIVMPQFRNASVNAFDSPLPSPTAITSPTAETTRSLPWGTPDPRAPLGPQLYVTPPSHTSLPSTPIPSTPVAPGNMALAGVTAVDEQHVQSVATDLVRHRLWLPRVMTVAEMQYGRKGIGDDWRLWENGGPGTNIGALAYESLIDWTFAFLPQRNSDLRYVRMVWCAGGSWMMDVNRVNRSIADTAASDRAANRVGRVWLVYNEPDDIKQCGADRLASNPEGMADHYVAIYHEIKNNDPTARIFVGGLLYLNAPYTQDWWVRFVNRLTTTGNRHTIEGVHVHLYPRYTTSDHNGRADCASTYCIPVLMQIANDWYQNYHVALGLGDRPIWITEAGWLGESDCTQNPDKYIAIRDNVMRRIAQWFTSDPAWPYPSVSTNPGYASLSWYVTRDIDNQNCTYLLNDVGPSAGTTPLGDYWNAYPRQNPVTVP